jgi:hypothetical protein
MLEKLWRKGDSYNALVDIKYKKEKGSQTVR